MGVVAEDEGESGEVLPALTGAEAAEAAGSPGEAPASGARAFPIVGVGASAGGLEALERLFQAAPLDAGLAYVVVQHLSPDFKSLMEELLARHTRLPIRRVVDGIVVEPDVIYLIPPNTDMIIAGGRLHLTERDPEQVLSLPIDLFLRSLADDAGDRAVAVILSGSGSDGSRGVRAVHEAGGLVVVQEERTAKFDSMPRSAIDTEVADHVVPPEAIAAVLVQHARTRPARTTPAPLEQVVPEGLAAMFVMLRREFGIDFSSYKPTTVLRRVQRRLALGDTPDVASYVARLEREPAELDAIYRDLLIGVTRFFRDPDAFTRLKATIDTLVQRLPAGEELRIWVAGCATGEEAYTVAMVALDALHRQGRRPLLKVFATDVHRASLETAGAGRYAPEALRAVPAPLRDAYFQPQGEHFVVRSELRTHVVFAVHNLLRDAPFTRLDLVTCRNLLIYFQPHAQRRVLSSFHFGMKAGAALLLGPSETPGELSDEFQAIDEHWKLYRKRRDVRLLPDLRLSTPEVPLRRRPGRQADPLELLASAARDLLVEEYAPAALVVNARGALVETLNGASAFLLPRDGAASLSAVELVHKDLRFAVAHGLKRAADRREASTFVATRVRLEGGERVVDVSVHPLVRGDELEATVVTLRPTERVGPLQLADPAIVGGELDRLAAERIDALEHELRHTKENLQATIEEMETSNEELQATNEELVASNEELQSTNEELHSVNEELYTVNAEHQLKIGELLELTTDVENLLASTEVHTLFLDRELRLRKFTPRVGETFNLLPQDVGRRIDSFTHTLDYPDLLVDVRRVLDGGARVEREAMDRAGRWFLVRTLPYTSRAGIDGVVITLVDVSTLRRTQDDLRLSEERYRSLVRALAGVVWALGAQGEVIEAQAEWEEFTGQRWPTYRGDRWLTAVSPDDLGRVRAAWRAAVESRSLCRVRARIWCEARGEYRHCELRGAPVLDADGAGGAGGHAPREWIATIADVHDEVLAQEERRRVEQQLQAILANSPAFIHVKDLQGRYVLVNAQSRAYLDAGPEEVKGKTDADLLPADRAELVRRNDRRVAVGREVIEVEETLPTADGERTWLSVKFPLHDLSGAVVAVAAISSDITERNRAIAAAREAVERRDRFLAMLSHELRNPLAAVVAATYTLRHPDLPAANRARAPEIIQRQADHLARLLDDLLDVARVATGRIQVRREPLDLAAVISRAVEQQAGAFTGAGVQLSVEVPPGPLPIDGDATRLQQVVGNLLANAAKYTPAGGRADLQVERRADQVVLRLRDTGVGIAPDQLERVFELFYQDDASLDRSAGGLGIGLTLARSVARLHGGDLVVSSEGRGRGSEFLVTLPVATSPPAADPSAVEPASPAGLRLVLAEDSADTRELLAGVLSHAGHQVEAAADGAEALELIRRVRPHVAFVDIGLPSLDGYELARRVRGEPFGRAVRLVAMTGYGRAEDRQRALLAGFDEHLVKPVDPDIALAIVDHARARRGGGGQG